MGSAWHKKSATAGREWVTYAAAGVVLLVIAGVVTGVVVAKSGGGGDSQPAATADAAGSTTATPQLPPPVVVSSPPAVPAPVAVPSPSPAPVPLPASPTPAPVPAVPAPVVAPTPVPVPVPASPVPAAPASPSPPTNNAPTTYDPSYVTKSTVGNTRTAAGFDLPVVEAGKAGTCEVHTKRLWICNDGMDGATDQTPFELLSLMHDPEALPTCGFFDMDAIVNSLVKWAYKGDCGAESYTVARACIGNPGTAGEGHWRARVMLWPVAGSTCEPLCIKMRGKGDAIADYGRHGSCNENKTSRRRFLSQAGSAA